jgi:hypothetical protein
MARDILDRNNTRGENKAYRQKGFAVWSLRPTIRRSVAEGVSKESNVIVVYNCDEDPEWAVELKHHFYKKKIVKKGWGSSRSEKAGIDYTMRSTERKFKTRKAACALAEKLVAAIERVLAKREEAQ